MTTRAVSAAAELLVGLDHMFILSRASLSIASRGQITCCIFEGPPVKQLATFRLFNQP